VTDPSDPPRWLDPGSAASARVREVLREARADVGTDEEVARLEAALLPLIGAPLAGSGAAASSGATSGGAASGGAASGAAKVASVSAAKLALGAGVAVVAASAAVWFGSPSRAPQAPAPASSAVVSAPSPAAPNIAAPNAAATETASAGPTESEPSAPSVPVPAEPEPKAAQSPRSSQAAGAQAPSSLSEADLLGQAQAALTGDPARALRLADQHRARFPGGVLGQEREVIAIEALVRLGRTTAARDRAARFQKVFPSSAHRSKIDSLVAPR
jgi:hypothetical protein